MTYDANSPRAARYSYSNPGKGRFSPRAEAEAALMNERNRSAGLISLGETAAKLGVPFDVSEALASGMSLDEATARVFEVATGAAQAAQTVEPASGGGLSAGVKAAWKRGLTEGYSDDDGTDESSASAKVRAAFRRGIRGEPAGQGDEAPSADKGRSFLAMQIQQMTHRD